MDAKAYAPRLLDDTAGLVFKLLLAMLAVALVDLIFTRWEYADKLRMSRRELKDEHKQREGDPQIKAPHPRAAERDAQQEPRRSSTSRMPTC